jgi:hypothetical protein
MRCGSCGARNPDTADWCSQCFVALGSAPAATGDAPGVAPAPTDDPASTRDATPHDRSPGDPAPGPVDEAPGATDDGGRDVRERDGEVEWRCATCDAWSSLHAPRCERCGAPRTGFGVDQPEALGPEDAEQLVVWTLLLPGLGHVRAGRVGSGVARGVIAVGWLLGAILLAVGAVGAGTAPVAAAPLALGAAAIWVASVRDVAALARGESRELLDARGLLWLVAGVTGLLVVTLLVQTMRLTG